MRIAAVQPAPVFDDAARACDVVADRLHWPEEWAVDLVLFPEAFLLGHSYGMIPDDTRPRGVRRRAVPARRP